MYRSLSGTASFLGEDPGRTAAYHAYPHGPKKTLSFNHDGPCPLFRQGPLVITLF